MAYKWRLILWFLVPFYFQAQVSSSFLKQVKSSVTESISFDKNDFKSDSQFWAMCEDRDGILIFGNNDGILTYDGEYWKTIPLPNHSSVRSLMIDDGGVIWVGGYNEIGNLKKDDFGNYYYHSLIDELLLNNSNLENNWKIHDFHGKVVYRSFKELIVIMGKSATHIKANQAFVYSGIVNDILIVQDATNGIYALNEEADKLTYLFNSNSIENGVITASFPVNNQEAFFVTQEGNIFLANLTSKTIVKKIKLFEKGHIDPINCGVQKNDSTFLLGTLSSKIIELKKDGSINRTNITFSKVKNTAILNFYKLKSNNIWVLHNNGIACLDFNSQYANIFDHASVYDILIENKTIYLATNEGVYYINNFDDLDFKVNKIEDLPGQAWTLTKLNGDILIGHNDGLFVLNNNIPEQIGNTTGFWKITPLKDKKNLFLASNYNGLFLLEKVQSKWVLKHQLKGFDESTRDILPAEDPNTFWVCHGYKGVYKIVVNPDYTRVESVEQFTTSNGFKSPFSINVVNYNGQIVFTTNNGIFTYNKKTKTFVPYPLLNKILDTSKNTRKLLYTKDKTWFVQDDEAGYFLNSDPKKQLIKAPFLNLKGMFNKGMESVLPYEDYVFLGSNKGLFLYNINTNNTKKAHTVFTNISYVKNQAKNYAPIINKKTIEFPNASDILRFEFSAPEIAPYADLEYSYFLEGSDFEWSEWSSLPFKEYAKLPYGNYTFKVKSKSHTGVEGNEATYAFTILPLWYQTSIAYFLYSIAFLILTYLAYRLLLKKIQTEKRKTKLETLKDQKLVRLELEQLKLSIEQEKIKEDNTHLEMDLIDKSKELANYTLLLSKRKEAFQELNNDLKQLKELVKSSESKNKIVQIFKKLNQNKIGEKYLEIFDVNFERVNTNFFRDLKRIDPSFSQRELRLCALIKTNLSNKEISHILNISSRGVETARYRIRKKLNLKASESLTLFLENLNAE
ncbi:regulatory LuxR family protein [Mariniflexile fucanivorans]|uniref:Regulatory LuxR family protein n=1 Tax=Mariniflexile fucanivorans TaxID=264023 RepID=A0A4R1RMB2_9FLAO|nr:triple tyrosine motif-containing protein [Mariniflexile fucanivorans]TCL66942.1 regulatory LuxR family protein [Mariniflexile fucanivorans]